MPGALVISLDFELHWGIRDHTTVDGYRDNLLGVREAIPALLAEFDRRGIACTWATVGMLMAESKKELLATMPARAPRYGDRRMSPYQGLEDIGEDERSDPFHFAPSLVRRIVATPRQELGTHTFSHFYMLENGPTLSDFDADLDSARRIAENFGVANKSIVFPRNQFTPEHLPVLRRHGIVAYRSNGRHWAYSARARETSLRRSFRLADTYAPLTGTRDVPWPTAHDGLVDVSASAFLRPAARRPNVLARLRLRRLVASMKHAAETHRLFHVWWHPHNFGIRLRENMAFLGELLDAYDQLRRTRSFESLTMGEVASRALALSS